MATIRKALAYSKKPARAFTRTSKRKHKSYIKSIPFSKIVKFDGGAMKDYRSGNHPYKVSLITEEGIHVRDNALEACRMFITKFMEKGAFGQYYIMVRVHPHHFLRENKSVAAVAGADRLSTGMTRSFGTVVGRAAQAKPGKVLFFVSCANEKVAQVAKAALTKIKPKVPAKTRVVFEKLK
jgi:ribosomal protein L10e